MEYETAATRAALAHDLTPMRKHAEILPSVKTTGRALQLEYGTQNPQVGVLEVMGVVPLATTALASTLGIFASIRAVEQRYSPLDAATSHASQEPSEGHGTRRMVQFLNPWDWLKSQVRGLSKETFGSMRLRVYRGLILLLSIRG